MQEIVLFMVLQWPDLQCRRVFEDTSGELRIGLPFVVKNLVKLVLAVRRLAPLSLVNFAEIFECFKERNCHSRLVEIVYGNGE